MRPLIKNIFLSVSVILVLPALLFYRFLRIIFKTDSLFSGFSQLLRIIPGRSGNYLRAGFYRYTMAQCSIDSVISFLVFFAQQDTEVASGVYIGPNCNIGSCKIGKNTLLGSGVHAMSGNRQHIFDDPDLFIKDHGSTLEKISIGEDCQIGNGALILANVVNKCVVGAGSIVTNDIPAYSVVTGHPARIVKSRKNM